MHIGVDIDGVLADLNPEFIHRVKFDFGVIAEDNLSWDEVLEKHNLPKNYIIRRLFPDEWFWSKALPYQENIDTLNAWRKFGHRISLITGRNPSETGMVTRAWLRRMKVGHDHLVFVPVGSKAEYMIENDVSIIIEDRFFEANRCAAFKLRSFVVRRPWNVEYESRVTNPLLKFVDSFQDMNNFVMPGGLIEPAGI